MATKTSVKGLLIVIKSLLDTIKNHAGTLGIPAGDLYVACMAHGCTLAQFQEIEAVILGTELVYKRGDLYFWKG